MLDDRIFILTTSHIRCVGFTWWRSQIDAVACEQFLYELEVLQAILHAAVHELHVLLADAAFDGRGHLDLMWLAAKGQF